MYIKPHNTKFPFNIIMDFSFWLSKLVKKKINNNKFIQGYNKWPTTEDELRLFFDKWEYRFDPAHGIINMVAHPKDTMLLANGDCDDYAAKLYALCPFEEKYILTYFTHDLKKWHTVFVWYNNKTDSYNSINWWMHNKNESFDKVLDGLKEYSKSPWYDYHLASFDRNKNQWVSYYK